jgi:hypothetical protein
LDGVLRGLSEYTEPVAVRRKLDCLVAKGRILERGGRHDEATVVLDGAVVAYRELPEAERDDRSLGQVVHALLLQAASIGALNPVRAASLLGQLTGLLGDPSEPAVASATGVGEPPTDGKISATLAELNNGQCWVEFATSGEDPASLPEMASKALDLYRMTGRWLAADRQDAQGPPFGAVMVIRGIADGYALLSRRWSADERAALPLPSSLLMEFAVRQAGIADWAAELGHPLQLSDSDDLAESLLETDHEASSAWNPDLTTEFTTAIRHYEILGQLLSSTRGRAAVRTTVLRRFAIDRIVAAHQLAVWLREHHEDAAGIAMTGVFVAQALFVATHDTITSAKQIFPGRTTLRELLVESDTLPWLEQHDIEPPDWLADTEN